MTDPIRWGILSTGSIAASFFNDLRLLPDAEVAAFGSRTVGSALAFAERHGIDRAYGSWQELAAAPDLDVIYVATPHSAHFDATMTCLAEGRAVLTEKPLTLGLASSRQLIDAATSAGVFLMEAMWTRCFPVIREITGRIAAGDIGTVTTVQADFGISGPFPPGSRLLDPALGGGALLDLGVYPLTLAHLILGAPDEISAWASLTPAGVDQNTAITLGYASGALAQLSCSLVGDTGQRATITGTTGRIELDSGYFHPDGYTLVRANAGADDRPEVVRRPHAGVGYHFEAAEVHRCLRAGRTESPLVGHADTLAVMSIMDAVLTRIGVSYP